MAGSGDTVGQAGDPGQTADQGAVGAPPPGRAPVAQHTDHAAHAGERFARGLLEPGQDLEETPAFRGDGHTRPLGLDEDPGDLVGDDVVRVGRHGEAFAARSSMNARKHRLPRTRRQPPSPAMPPAATSSSTIVVDTRAPPPGSPTSQRRGAAMTATVSMTAQATAHPGGQVRTALSSSRSRRAPSPAHSRSATTRPGRRPPPRFCRPGRHAGAHRQTEPCGEPPGGPQDGGPPVTATGSTGNGPAPGSMASSRSVSTATAGAVAPRACRKLLRRMRRTTPSSVRSCGVTPTSVCAGPPPSSPRVRCAGGLGESSDRTWRAAASDPFHSPQRCDDTSCTRPGRSQEPGSRSGTHRAWQTDRMQPPS